MDKQQQNIETRPGDAERPHESCVDGTPWVQERKRDSDERVDCAHVSGLADAAP